MGTKDQFDYSPPVKKYVSPISKELEERMRKQGTWQLWLLPLVCVLWGIPSFWISIHYPFAGPLTPSITAFLPLFPYFYYMFTASRRIRNRFQELGFDWLDAEQLYVLHTLYRFRLGKLKLPLASDFDTIPGDGNRLDKLVFLIDELNRPREKKPLAKSQ